MTERVAGPSIRLEFGPLELCTPEPTDISVSQLIKARARLDDELARHQQAVTVLFVDIVGSTRFYEKHGDVAGLTMVQKFLDQLMPVLEEHGGVIVKEIGDAVLARFPAAVDAVRSALHMQMLFLNYNSTRSPVEQIHIRVALNAGFALIKGQDVFGDVVNVCSRIESKAEPDDILISPSVFDQICQEPEFAVRKRAEGVELKGKAEKLDLYEVVWQLDERLPAAPPRPSESQVALSAMRGGAEPSGVKRAHRAAERLAALRRTWTKPGLFRSVVKTLAVGAVVLLVVIGWGIFFSSRNVTALTEKDTIVLADFDNRTGDAVFDDTLKQALAVDLEQSPFLNVLSHRKTMTTLLMMGRSPEQPILGQVARDLCQRVGSKALLAGSIAKLGNNYVIGLEAVNCATGDALIKQQVQARGKEEVLKALGKASLAIRSKLGESLASVQKFATPIEEATTSSLDALKAFSLARRASASQGQAAALPYYERAVELDPNFASAYGDLALSYSNLGQTTRAVENITRAHALQQRVSERERYRITSIYYLIATGELEKSNETFALWKQTYPRDFFPVGDLGSNLAILGEWEKAVKFTQEAFQLEPNNATNVSNLAFEQLALGQTEAAKATIEQALSRNLDAYYLRVALYEIAFLGGDEHAMQQQLTWARGRSREEDWLFSTQSDTEAYFGRLQAARTFSQRAVDSARLADANEAAALWAANGALREAEFGNSAMARKQAGAALGLSTGRDVRIMAALALARAGDAIEAQKMADALDKENPQSTLIQGYWLPAIRAALALGANHPDKAIEFLRTGEPYELGQTPPFTIGTLYPAFLRGEAYLAEQRGGEAAAEFRKILDHRGIVLNFPLGALAQRSLARSYALQGDNAKARVAYDEFLKLWKDADTDIPVLQQARAESAKLR